MTENSAALTKKKRFTLQGQSEEQLERRIQTLLRALRLRHGAILRVKRRLPASRRALFATVYYRLPVASLCDVQRLPARGQAAQATFTR